MRTPGPYENESPRAYFLRLTEENGYDSPAALFELIEASGEYVPTVGWDYQKLQPLLGSLQVLPLEFGYRAGVKKSKETASLLGHEVHPKHLGLKKARICTDCLAEYGYAPAYWDLKAFVACHKHGRMLLKHCNACGERVRYARPGLLICKCGADLREMRGQPAQTELVGLMEVIVAKTSNEHSLPSAYAVGLPVEHLLRCDLAVLCRLIVGISTVHAWQTTRKRTPMSATDVAKYIPDAARSLSCWPLNFYSLCKLWHSKSQGMGNSKYFQIQFSWLFITLYKNLKERKQQTLFLIEAALNYGLRAWDVSPIRIKGEAAKIESLPPRRFGTYTDVAAAIGVPIYTVHRWLVKKKLPSKKVVGCGRKKFRAVDMEEVGKIRISASRAIGQREAARLVGVPYGVYKALRRSGLIQTTYVVDIDLGIAVEDVLEFKQKVLTKAVRCESLEGKVPFAEALAAGIPIAKKVAAITKIMSGELKAFLQSGDDLRNLYLDVDLVQQHLLGARYEADELSVHAASLRYGITFYEARAIFLALTHDEKHLINGRVATLKASKLEEFLAQNIPLKRIAKDERVSGIALRCILEREAPAVLRRLSAGCGPSGLPGDATGSFILRRGVRKARALAKRLRVNWRNK